MKIIDKSTKYNSTHKKLHSVWRSLISRDRRYENIILCDKWKTYDGFLEDVDKIEGFDLKNIVYGNLQLDKDKKQFGNEIKTYSLETCCWLTPSENTSYRRNNKYFLAIHLESQKVYLEINREKFCRENDLDTSTVWRMLQTNSGVTSEKYSNTREYKGFMFFYINDFSMDKLIEKPRFVATNIDTGENIIFTNRRKFAREHNVPYQSVLFCIKGTYKRTGCYTITQIENLSYKSSTTIESKVNNLLKQVE